MAVCCSSCYLLDRIKIVVLCAIVLLLACESLRRVHLS